MGRDGRIVLNASRVLCYISVLEEVLISLDNVGDMLMWVFSGAAEQLEFSIKFDNSFINPLQYMYMSLSHENGPNVSVAV